MATISALLDAANKHIEDGSIEDAEVLCRQALSRAPRSVRALKVYGMCQIATGDMDAAIKSFEFILQMEPEDAAACYNLALAQQARGELERARFNFERALSLDPANPACHEAMAGLHVYAGEIEDALRHLMIAIDLKPGDPGILANFGSVLAQVGAHYDARSYFEEVLKLQPDNGPVAMQLAQIHHDLGEHDKGIELTENLYLKSPRNPVYLAAFAHSLARIGELERAADLVDTALKMAPETANALEEYALISAYRGAPERGIAKFASLLKRQKDNPPLCLLMATALARAGRHDEAVTLARAALHDPATHSNALTLIRQELFQEGRFKEALELTAQAGVGPGAEAGLTDDPDKVIIPLETKPLEAILFCRFLQGDKLANGAGADRTVHAHEPLIPLLRRMTLNRSIRSLEGQSLFTLAETGNGCFITSYAARPEIAGYDPAGFTPYIETDPRADDFWRGSLAPLKRPLCGIVWSRYPPEPLLHDLESGLREWPGTLVSLVWDDQRAELVGYPHIIDAGRHLTCMEALIDLVGKLDLVAGPDGLVTHIAGAMGVPALVLVNPDKKWYWYAPDGRSHWYPSAHVLERPWDQPMEEFQKVVGEKAAEMAQAVR